jgi:hypothetical protein
LSDDLGHLDPSTRLNSVQSSLAESAEMPKISGQPCTALSRVEPAC